MKNKNILITGGTSGIGLAAAQHLQAEGAQVLVTGRNPQALAAAQATLGPRAIVLQSDSASLEDAQGLGNLVKRHVPKLDGVFLNAGIAQFGPIEAMTPTHYEQMFDINVRGLFFQLQAILGILADPSSVVMNASIVGSLGLPNMSIYSATKAAVISFGKTLAVELGGRGIRVNTISPGPIATPAFGKLGLPAEMQKGMEEQFASQSVFKRMGKSDEVSRLVRFLLSEESSFITGDNVTIDGGVRLT